MLRLGFTLFEYFFCIGAKEVSLSYLANVLFFISGLCFVYYFTFVYVRHVIDDDIDSLFSEYSAKNLKTNKIVANKYVPTYQDYYKLPWYERNMMSYIDCIKYRTMRDDPDHYFDNIKVVNFDIIHHKRCGDKLIDIYKGYNIIKNEGLNRCLTLLYRLRLGTKEMTYG